MEGDQVVEGVDGGVLREIPIRYGGDDGPDLTDVAGAAGISEEEVVAIHAGAHVRRAFIVSPGFPYLLGLDPRIATPRLDSPRVRIPAGSVGIGGPYTGIYRVQPPAAGA